MSSRTGRMTGEETRGGKRRGDEETHLGIRSSSQAVLTNQDGEAQDGFGLALCFCLQIY